MSLQTADQGSARGEGGALPNLLILGIQKCGTSALHYYLDLHPEIGMSAPKETNFFSRTPELSGLPAADREVVGGFGGDPIPLDWYRSLFDPADRIRGEASPSYTAPYFPGGPERIAGLLDDPFLIVLVRDPFEQIPSSWQHNRSLSVETRPLAEAVLPDGMYLKRVRFRDVLEPYLEVFGRDRLLVIDQAELLGERREAMRRIFAFLGVSDPDFWSPKMERRRHVTAEKGRRKRLLDRLQRSRLAKPLYALPQEAKWWIERAFAGRGGEGAAEVDAGPGLSRQQQELVRSDLSPHVEWLGAEFGIDVSGWMR